MITTNLLWIVFPILLGSLMKLLGPTPKQTIITILDMREDLPIPEVKILAKRVFTWKLNVTLLIGAIGAIFSLIPLVAYAIGVILVYIVKTLPEIREELINLDLADQFVNKLIEEFLNKKETDEKA